MPPNGSQAWNVWHFGASRFPPNRKENARCKTLITYWPPYILCLMLPSVLFHRPDLALSVKIHLVLKPDVMNDPDKDAKTTLVILKVTFFIQLILLLLSLIELMKLIG